MDPPVPGVDPTLFPTIVAVEGIELHDYLGPRHVADDVIIGQLGIAVENNSAQFAEDSSPTLYSKVRQSSPKYPTFSSGSSQAQAVFLTREKTTPFGAWLLDRRVEKGLSLRGLSARCGVDRKTLSLWERGLQTPNPANASKLIEPLEADLATLLDKLRESEHGNDRGSNHKGRA